jgi:DNA invertase Pin-like site-specific DNA recombinase
MGNGEKIRTKVGYARVSTTDQTTENQISEFKKLGIAEKDIYDDKGISGTVPAKKRKGFKQVYEKIINGEVEELYVFELSRLGRTSSESIMLFIEIEQLGTRIKSLSPNETWTNDIGNDQAMRNVFTSIFTWFADIERRHISERTRAGLQRAREEGTHLGRAFKEPDRKQYDKLKTSNLKVAQIARVMQVPTSTLYRWVERWEDEERVIKNSKL